LGSEKSTYKVNTDHTYKLILTLSHPMWNLRGKIKGKTKG